MKIQIHSVNSAELCRINIFKQGFIRPIVCLVSPLLCVEGCRLYGLKVEGGVSFCVEERITPKNHQPRFSKPKGNFPSPICHIPPRIVILSKQNNTFLERLICCLRLILRVYLTI